MKRTEVALCVLLLAGRSLSAGAIVEGNVPRAAGAKIPASSGRYKPTVDPIGKPDPLRAVIFLEGDFPKGNVPKKVEIGQRHYQFTPGLLAIQKGTEVTFPNRDNEFHSVFSYSKAKRFDLGQYRKDEKPPVRVFEKPGVVDLYCQIHGHMRGTILVLDTPYFTQSDPVTGAYRLENLPPGIHKLKMWFNDKEVERAVELKE